MILTLFCWVERKIRYVVWLGNTTEFTDLKVETRWIKKQIEQLIGQIERSGHG